MAGLLDGDFSGFVGDDKTKDEFGQTEADRRAPLWSGLINAGLLAVAGGGNLMPAERAKYIAAAGGALGGIGTDMIQARSAAAQQALRAQEIKGKQVDLAQAQKWREYADSPDFQQAMDQAKASPAERMAAKAAALKGDFATVSKILDPKRGMPKVDASGNITLESGDVYNQTYGWVVKDGKVVDQNAATGGGGGGGGVVPPQNTDDEIKQWSNYDDPHVRNNQPPPKTATGYQPVVSPFEGRNYSVLNNLNPVLASQVQRVGDYQEQISARQLKDPRLLKLVSDYTTGPSGSSDWNQGEYAFRNQQRKEYSMAGATGKGMNAMDTSYAHLGTLRDAAAAMQQALDTGNSALANDIKIKIAKQFGQPEGVAFQTVAAAVSNEVAKAFRGAGQLNQAEQEHMQGLFNQANSPRQIQAAIQYSLELLEGKEKAIKNSWMRDMRTPMRDFLSPASREKAEFIRNNPLGGAPAAAASAPAGGYATTDGKPVSAADIAATAKNRGMTEAQVIKALGLKPVQ